MKKVKRCCESFFDLDYMKNCTKSFFSKYKLVFICTFSFAFISFGMYAFNKFTFNDEAAFFDNVGCTFEVGRWMLGTLGLIVEKVFGANNSLPVLNIFCTFLYLSLSIILLQNLFGLSNRFRVFLLCLVLTTSPVLATIFTFYTFTAPYYFFGLLLSVIACVLVCKHRKWYCFLIATILQAMSVGIYQAFIPFVLSCLLVYYIIEVLSFEHKPSAFLLIKRALYYTLFCASFIIAYFAITKLSTTVVGVNLMAHKGMNQIGQESILTYLVRIKDALLCFVNPNFYVSQGYLPSNLSLLYYAILLAFVSLSFIIVIQSFRKSVVQGSFVLLAVVMLPIAINFIFIMCSKSVVYATMMYGCNSLYICILVFSKLVKVRIAKRKNCLAVVLGAVLLFTGVSNVYYDNQCALKAQFFQDRLMINYAQLITRIKSTKGYDDEMPISFIDIEGFSDSTLKDLDQPSVIQTTTNKLFLQSYNYKKQIAVLTGFSPDYIDAEEYANNEIVKNMPSYPDDGSIRVIDNAVVVKF